MLACFEAAGRKDLELTADIPRLVPGIHARYVLNVDAKRAHLALVKDGLMFTLEDCNIDQIAAKDYANSVPPGYDPCDNCQPRMETHTA